MVYLQAPWQVLAEWGAALGHALLWTAFVGSCTLTAALAIPVGRNWFAGHDFHPLRGLLGVSAAMSLGSGMVLFY